VTIRFGEIRWAAKDSLPSNREKQSWTGIRKHHILGEIMIPSPNRRPRKQLVDLRKR